MLVAEMSNRLQAALAAVSRRYTAAEIKAIQEWELSKEGSGDD